MRTYGVSQRTLTKTCLDTRGEIPWRVFTMDYDEGLTPVEEHNGIFKRDDLYAPYGEDFVTGGKIRQCRDLIRTNLDYINEECGGTISTASSIHSPQIGYCIKGR